jgi:hypothetical protein
MTLRTYPTQTGQWQVSSAGSSFAVWSPRSDAIYYRDVLQEVKTDEQRTASLGIEQKLACKCEAGVGAAGFAARSAPMSSSYFLLRGAGPRRFLDRADLEFTKLQVLARRIDTGRRLASRGTTCRLS